MNNIKRRIAVSMLLIFVLVCGLLSACGSGGSGKDNKTPDATDSAQIETTASAEEPGADQSEQASSEIHKITDIRVLSVPKVLTVTVFSPIFDIVFLDIISNHIGVSSILYILHIF